MAHYIMESQYYGTEALILMRRHEIIFSLLKKKILLWKQIYCWIIFFFSEAMFHDLESVP